MFDFVLKGPTVTTSRGGAVADGSERVHLLCRVLCRAPAVYV